MHTIELKLDIPTTYSDQRLDLALSKLLTDYSRGQIQSWIKAGQVTINYQQVTKPRHLVYEGDHIEIKTTLSAQEQTTPQQIDMEIVFEDKDLLIINKPAGLVVHPGAGNQSGTLVNALLYHDPSLELLPRAGLVHRLDKDTSGLLIVARHIQSYHHLINAMQAREIKRQYLAIVQGLIISGGSIDEPIGRHSTARTKMAVHPKGKSAITHYRINQKFRAHTCLDVHLETGRTHQIRVHLTHLGYPLIGDKTYKKQKALEAKISLPLQEAISAFERQALHAIQLTLNHPRTEETLSFQAPLPEDLNQLIGALDEDANASDQES